MTGYYGEPMRMELEKLVEFPDFSVEYVGEREEQKITYYDYRVTDEMVEQIISWAIGTGEVEAVQFEAGGRQFEMRGLPNDFQIEDITEKVNKRIKALEK